MISNQTLRQANYQVRLGTFVLQLFSTIGLLSIILIAAWRLASYPEVGISWLEATSEITFVDQQGPASNLLQVGGIITNVNGRPISEVNLAREFQLTSPIEIQIERDGRPMTINVQAVLPSPTVILQRTTSLIAAFTFWLLSLVFLLFRTNDVSGL